MKPVEPNGGNGGDPGPSPQLLKRIHDKRVELASLRGALAGARARADAAGSTLAAVAARVAAADNELHTAQAEVARLSALLTEAQAAEREALELATNKGYIHAPSLGQAATAAVLRSGHLAHRREADSPLEIDLSSRRVRLALGLLDGARHDQPLGALLGYRFERGLHEDHPGLALDQYIATLRALAPLDDSTEAEAQLRDALAREADLTARLGVLELQLKAHRDADQAAKDALRADLATAQAELDTARTSAEALANQLQQAQDALQELLDRVGEGDLPSRIPPWKLRDDDIPDAGIPPALHGPDQRQARADPQPHLGARRRQRRAARRRRRVSATSRRGSASPTRRSRRSSRRSPTCSPSSMQRARPSPPPAPGWRSCAASCASAPPTRCGPTTSPMGWRCGGAGRRAPPRPGGTRARSRSATPRSGCPRWAPPSSRPSTPSCARSTTRWTR